MLLNGRQLREKYQNAPLTEAGKAVLVEQYIYPNGKDGEELAKPIPGDHPSIQELYYKDLIVLCKGGWYPTDKGTDLAQQIIEKH